MITKKIHFIMAVWGDSYTNVFIDVVLPSQLTPNNLPGLQYNRS